MSRLRAWPQLALVLLVATAGAALGQDGADEDPFANEPGLFEDEEEDPFAELEERAALDDDEEDQANATDGNETRSDADEESEDRIPGPSGLAFAAIGLAAALLTRRRD